MKTRILTKTEQMGLMASTVSSHVSKQGGKLVRGDTPFLAGQEEKKEKAWKLRVKALSLIFALAIIGLISIGCGGVGTSLGTPVITGITPSSVAIGSSITITGTNLNGTYTTATFVLSTTGATYSATASSGTTTSVSVAVPTTIPAGTFNVDVVTSDSNGDQSSASNTVSIVIT